LIALANDHDLDILIDSQDGQYITIIVQATDDPEDSFKKVEQLSEEEKVKALIEEQISARLALFKKELELEYVLQKKEGAAI
jgi:ABC-type metal ion transport system substrate-binding protein